MDTVEKTLMAMKLYGGSFVQSLATCYRYADHKNRLKLTRAFPEEFAKYAVMAEDMPD